MGRRGSGKSTMVKALTKIWPNRNRLYIFDPLDEYDGLGCITCYSIDDCMNALEGGEAFIRLANPAIDQAVDMFDVLREIDDILIVIDEADLLLRNQHNPDSVSWIFNYGRHVNQGMILAARRPTRLPREFTAQSILFFPDTLEPRDRQYIKDRLGEEPLPVGEYCWSAHSFDGELTIFDKSWAQQVLGRV